jgi:proteasome lid subunit RPN8/RPN11
MRVAESVSMREVLECPDGGHSPGRGIGALAIRSCVVDAMVHRCRAALPNECFGVLGASGGVITHALVVTTRFASPAGFVADELDLARAEDDLNALSAALVGYFHSHPTGWESASLADMAAHSWAELAPSFHVIVGLRSVNGTGGSGLVAEPVQIAAYDTRSIPWRRVPLAICRGD